MRRNEFEDFLDLVNNSGIRSEVVRGLVEIIRENIKPLFHVAPIIKNGTIAVYCPKPNDPNTVQVMAYVSVTCNNEAMISCWSVFPVNHAQDFHLDDPECFTKVCEWLNDLIASYYSGKHFVADKGKVS